MAHPYPQTGLVGLWRFEGNALASHGTHDGTVENGPLSYPAASGKLYLGDKSVVLNNPPSSQCISLGESADFNPATPTISVWFYTANLTGDQAYFSRTNSSNKCCWSIWSSGSALKISAGSRAGWTWGPPNSETITWGTTLQISTWYHVVITLTTATERRPCYFVNGAWGGNVHGSYGDYPFVTGVTGVETLIGAMQSTTVGTRMQFATNPIDEAIFYNRSLTPEEIGRLYMVGTKITSNGGGDWSSSATWYPGIVPAVNNRVYIIGNDTVQIDQDVTIGDAPNNITNPPLVPSDTPMVMTIDGILNWKIETATDRTFKCRGSIEMGYGGSLRIGTAVLPIPADQKASFIFEKAGSTATVWQIMIANFFEDLYTATVKTLYGSLSIFGAPDYHMASAAMQRTRLTHGVPSGSGRTIVFDDYVDYEVGDTIYIGYGADPTIDVFSGAAIAAAYGSDTVTILTKIDARTYTANLTYTHVAGDMVIHKTRNVFFGCQDADSMQIRPILYYLGYPGYTRYRGIWPGAIDMHWAFLNKFEVLCKIQGPYCMCEDVGTLNVKNCVLQAPTNVLNLASANSWSWPWFEETTPHLDELHIFGLTGTFFTGLVGIVVGTAHWGHISIVDTTYVGSDVGLLTSYTTGNTNIRQSLEIDSLWVSYARSISNFNQNTCVFKWDTQLKVYSMRAHPVLQCFRFQTPQEGQEFVLNDVTVYHCYVRIFVNDNASQNRVTLTGCKFANVKTHVFSYTPGAYLPYQLECYDCDFDGIGGSVVSFSGDSYGTTWYDVNWKFVNCNFGRMIVNAYMFSFADTWFRLGGRILFENCQIQKPTNVTSSGIWTGLKAYCIRHTVGYPYVDNGYGFYDKINREYYPSAFAYEWANCQVYDDAGVDQWPIEYPNTKTVAVVGGGGEVHSEPTILVDGTLGMKMLPYAVQAPNPGNRARPIRIPLLEAEGITLKVSLRKNTSLPAGKRPAFYARGCGFDSVIEMTDVNNIWEELTITGTAQYEDTLEVWVEGGWNLYAGTSDDFWEPTALGTVLSYADKFVCTRTAPPAPKVISAQSLALNKVRVNFNRSMRIDDTLLQSGKGISQHTSLAANLIAYYKFDANVQDSGPNALHGEVFGGPVTYPAGKIGNGIKLNGINQYVKIPYNALLNPNYISIALWFRNDGNPSTAAQLIQKYNPGWAQYSIAFGYTPEVRMITGGAARQMSGLTAWSNGGWHFFALTYDGAWLKWRCDETVLRAAYTGTVNPYTTDLYIGAYYNGTVCSSFFNGMIDELMISGRGWTDEELGLIYNNGRGRKYLETIPASYAIDGGRSAANIIAHGFKSVDLTLDANMIAGDTYHPSVIASSGIVDAYGVKFDEANRSATFTCYNSIRTHPTLSDGSLCGAWLLDGDATDSSENDYDGVLNIGGPIVNWASCPATIRPGARGHLPMAYDSVRSKLIIFGGFTQSNTLWAPDTWEYSAAAETWAKVHDGLSPGVGNPSARYYHCMVYDTFNNKTVMFGGQLVIDIASLSNETWTWNITGTSWTKETTTGSPSARRSATMVYDSARHVCVLFGGWDGNADDETWEYNAATTTWTKVHAGGSPGDGNPSARYAHSAAYDSARNRMVVFGGGNGTGNNAVATETWEWNGATATWAKILPALYPAAGASRAMAYDVLRARIIYSAGYLETWEWAGTNWVHNTFLVYPTAAIYHAMAYDSDRNKVMCFGGGSGTGAIYDELWEHAEFQPGYVAGKVGQGFNFRMQPNSTAWINPMYLERKKLGNIAKFSVSCWVKFNSIESAAHIGSAERHHLVSKYSTTPAQSANEHIHWSLYKDNTNTMQFAGNGAGYGANSLAGPVATLNWTHYVIGYDGRTQMLYVNGVLYSTQVNAYPRPQPVYPFIPIRIGGCCIASTPPYPLADVNFVPDATVNQVLHFNRLLTSDEVKSLYGAGNGLVW